MKKKVLLMIEDYFLPMSEFLLFVMLVSACFDKDFFQHTVITFIMVHEGRRTVRRSHEKM